MSEGYNGNINLKRINVGIEWTPDLVQEYLKCSQDPIYFVEKYMKIVNVDKGLMTIDLYPYQHQILNVVKDNRYTIVATARQAGKTTSIVGVILHYIIFNPEKTVALLANKGDTAREILSRIQLAYQHLPKWLQQGIIEWNKGSFVLENNSRVIASSTSSDSIRGFSINLLFIDEAAFIENWDDFFTSVFPTISSGQSTKIILVSTPNGLNHFHKIWVDAEEGRNNYIPIRVTWEDVPGRDEKWKEETIAAMGGDVEKFNQEHSVEFLGSSGTLISGWKLKQLVHKHPEVSNFGLDKYESPIKDRIYVTVADVARGKGLDYSAFQIIDVTEMPYKQVCVYRNNIINPVDYAELLYKTVMAYNNSFLLVESNDIGGQISDILHYDFEYDNMLYTEAMGRNGKRISSGFGGKNVDKGIRTSKAVKSIGCSVMKMLIEQNQLIIQDYETIHELSTFSKKYNSYEAESGKHDDLVMCLVLFAWLTNQNYFKDVTDINTLLKLKEKTEEDMMEDLLPFGFLAGSEDETFIEETDSGQKILWNYS
jgi:hypothetical protein